MALSASDVVQPEPRISAVLASLQDWEFDAATGIDFEGQDVHLDGREFVDCSFRNCRIYITLGYFRMVNPRSFVDCQFFLAGPAEIMKTLVDLVEGRAGR
ncbi:MAG TPA: hypothetical protein VLS25_07455 [Dehalococcoidia bacterium]|nr:hypothetical protein [Dehalococcoidia bacterium]